jgi:nitroimidazol reductase NimA-like FMN-containing flavoprotein (pyridoxamine 5'-phosphate oxidase superfamily)
MSEQRDIPESVRIHRIPERGRYDRATIDAILDASVVCHLAGIDVDGRPLVIPMQHARVRDAVYLHGSAASRHLRRSGAGTDVSLAVTVLDGLVLAHRMFNHSVNYRSVVLRGVAVAVADDAEKLAALEAFSERLLPGRWAEAIPPDTQELRATTVLRLPIDEAAAKVREGWPGHVDEEEDLTSIWVGVVPVREVAGDPLPHPDIPADVPLSPAVAAWVAARR